MIRLEETILDCQCIGQMSSLLSEHKIVFSIILVPPPPPLFLALCLLVSEENHHYYYYCLLLMAMDLIFHFILCTTNK